MYGAYIKLTLPELTIDFNNFLLLFFLSSLKPPLQITVAVAAFVAPRSDTLTLALNCLSLSLSTIQRRSLNALSLACALNMKNTQCEFGSRGSQETRLTGVTSVNVSLEIVRLALTLNEADRGDTVHSVARHQSEAIWEICINIYCRIQTKKYFYI